FAAIQPARRWILRHSARARRLEASDDPLAELPTTTAERFLSGQVVLVGYGRVGRRIAAALAEAGVPYVVAEQNRELVESLRSQGVPAVSGDAADPAVLIQAHVARASMLVIATPDTLDVRQMAETANLLNPGIEIVVRTHNESEGELLQREQRIGRVFVGERELATAMVHFVLGRFGKV
ncbi:MAG: NAD-binding protein, partial [Aquincola sp.]|nr:NAD-binding protein [Aquincola sp.]